MIWADGRLDTFHILEVFETHSTSQVSEPSSDLPDGQNEEVDLLDMMTRREGGTSQPSKKRKINAEAEGAPRKKKPRDNLTRWLEEVLEEHMEESRQDIVEDFNSSSVLEPEAPIDVENLDWENHVEASTVAEKPCSFRELLVKLDVEDRDVSSQASWREASWSHSPDVQVLSKSFSHLQASQKLLVLAYPEGVRGVGRQCFASSCYLARKC